LRQTFVLDTNVVLYDPLSIFKFGRNDVQIPLICVEELDKFKKDPNENGRNARMFSRIVDDLRKQGPLSKGVQLENGGKLIISHWRDYQGAALKNIDLNKNDNLILGLALIVKEAGQNVTLITKDINLRLKADVLGVQAKDYATEEITLDELYSGQKLLDLDEDSWEIFKQKRMLLIDDKSLIGKSLFPNQYVVMKNKKKPDDQPLLGRYSVKEKAIVSLITSKEGIWGIYPKNLEQHFAFDALMNTEVQLVSLVGKAGTGKTLLAMAAGLEMAITQEKYSRVLVSRPIQPMGRDLGYLPGDIDEKIAPWMWPIFDSLDFLFGMNTVSEAGSTWENLLHRGLLHVEPLTYIRGRSIPSQFIIIDESQNLSPHEIKTIITRAGEHSKIVLTGDCEQIDNPYLDAVNNGLAHVVERLKQEKIVAHVTLKSGERSPLSEIASKLL
jgi:PhoH-like ATPase